MSIRIPLEGTEEKIARINARIELIREESWIGARNDEDADELVSMLQDDIETLRGHDDALLDNQVSMMETAWEVNIGIPRALEELCMLNAWHSTLLMCG